MEYTEKRDELIPALFKARKVMSSGAAKNTENKHLKSTYANLESFLDAIRPALEVNDLMLIQSWEVGEQANTIYLRSEIMHVSGQSCWTVSPFPLTKQDPHAVGSAITYARRYIMAALFGIAQADDDGNASRKTATDVVRSMKEAKDSAELQGIYTAARQYFTHKDDASQMRVITASYNELKSALVKPGDEFNPVALPVKKATDPQPVKVEDQSTAPAGDPNNF